MAAIATRAVFLALAAAALVVSPADANDASAPKPCASRVRKAAGKDHALLQSALEHSRQGTAVATPAAVGTLGPRPLDVACPAVELASEAQPEETRGTSRLQTATVTRRVVVVEEDDE
mmetsp:Transcript_87283/g.244986  ORF Transcript_87283/g.244986 Transcript_87283/m.244986 type:complete len:118 (-) Transcript_87283:162-515(-)|eukprot:CAMPEP_0117543394 /NCGR_PEP_ID=MMETSP0784-20121206/45040_1 /TAXON_ID=39447 /ORGANISM="" /LENGTH=117 /DNA_ID=CAMNT_0005340175 /DNA_START=84 /DNA_END=437 /DNA_ORIENTATION=+